ncbi:hypothetical protein V6N11_052317 [Hibiscus sabdariffa]|uniref:RNase H type-1 domain-containing protein n=1 Tax=Hibiscus sabdariffa TaxID=183260 RepID=A0ABR2U9U8_9ROSI
MIFFVSPLELWLVFNLDVSRGMGPLFLLGLVFLPSLLRQLWKQMNGFIFNGNSLPLSDIYKIGFTWASNFTYNILVQSPLLQPMIDSFKWQAPLRDWLCLNTDDAVSLSEHSGTIEGVFQDSSGERVKGYCKFVGIIFPLQVVLWNILVDLQLAWSIDVTHLQVKSHNSVAICLVLDPMAKTSSSPLVRAIALFSNLIGLLILLRCHMSRTWSLIVFRNLSLLRITI